MTRLENFIRQRLRPETNLSLFLHLLRICSLLYVAPIAFAQNAQWIPVQITDCPNCVITNLLFYTPKEGWAVAYQAGAYPTQKFLLRTGDGGETWVSQPITDSEYRIHNLSQFLNPLQGWAQADSVVYLNQVIANSGHNPGEDNSVKGKVRFYQSNDGGNSWSLREGVVTSISHFGHERAKTSNRRYFSALRFLNPQVGVLAGQLWEYRENDHGQLLFMQWRGRAIYSTEDGGDTWRAFLFGDDDEKRLCLRGERPDPIESIESVGSQYAWIPALSCGLGEHYLFRTQDGGRSWEALDMGDESPMIGKHVSFATPTEGWSWKSGGFIPHTSDGGKTWTKSNLPGWRVVFISPQEGWLSGGAAAIDADGVARSQSNIQHTLDGGKSWQVEYRTPQENGITRWESIGGIQHDPATRTIWAYGFRALLRRQGVITNVKSVGKLPVTWGALKR